MRAFSLRDREGRQFGEAYRLMSTALAGYLGLIGVLVFFAAFGLAVAGNRRRPQTRWRSQVISFSNGRVPWTERVRRWLRRNLR